jgi:hypothetical protein
MQNMMELTDSPERLAQFAQRLQEVRKPATTIRFSSARRWSR